jgi:hypothetical protein
VDPETARRKPQCPAKLRPDARAAALRAARATTWSDGALTLPELVDLYGRSGFDVLAVTDHVVRDGEPWCAHAKALRRGDHIAYLEEIHAEAKRARSLYDLLLIPGLELTFDDPDPRLAAHAVAVGLREHVDLEGGLDWALAHAREQGAALIGAHPYALDELGGTPRTTARYRGAGVGGRCRPPLRGLQPPRLLRLGCARPAAGRRERRLPPPRAPRHLEDAATRGEDRGGRR